MTLLLRDPISGTWETHGGDRIEQAFAETDKNPANPSCRFYEAIGGEVQRDDAGKLNRGSYIWRDLRVLASICPPE